MIPRARYQRSLFPLALGQGAFSLDGFLASQADGFNFDWAKTDRHFQEPTGPTLADDVGEAIGLAMDQRLWMGATLADVLSAQSNLISGAWSLSVSGTATATESPAGTLNLTGDGTNGAIGDHSMVTVAGRTYCITATVSASVFAYVGSTQGSVSIINGLSLSAGQKIFYFVATGSTSWIRFFRGPATVAAISGISAQLVPGYAALQASGTLKPIRQAAGAKFDGSDDNLLTAYLAAAGANFVVARVSVPSSLAALQVIAGASGSSANRTFLGIDTSGRVCGGVGSDSTGTIVGAADLRNSEAVVGLSYDGTDVRLFAGEAEEYSAAQASTPTTTIPYRIGALNNNGTAGSFFSGAVKKLVAGREHLTLSRYRQIRAALLAA